MKHSLVKDTIIQTASDLFYRNGYNLTGINEIIKEAGIAKATLYNHFQSKEDICLAYLEHKNTTFLTQISAYANAAPHGKDQLLALFDFLNVFFDGTDFNGCWCIKTVAEIPTDNVKIRTEIQNQKNDFLKLIEGLVIVNLESVQDPGLVAKQVYLLYEGAVAESHLHQNAWPIASARQMCDQILD